MGFVNEIPAGNVVPKVTNRTRNNMGYVSRHPDLLPANNKGAGQQAHPRRLTSTFAVHPLKSIITNHAV